ncbi:MAG: AzlD domain-containing protein [Paracoccaceae bacterium]
MTLDLPSATIWGVILGLGVATFLIRFSFLGFLGGRTLPEGLVRALSFVPVTVIPALVVPMIARAPDGSLAADPPRIAAGIAALAAGIATRSLVWGILGGVAGYAAVAAFWGGLAGTAT